jgi:lipopolysaccharide transport system permease protein
MPDLDIAETPALPVEIISTTGKSFWGYLDPLRTVRGLWRHRGLIWQLAWRDLRQRYQGSILGLAWAFLMPLFHLAVYTFVFNVVLQARWNQAGDQSRLAFALALFCGLILFNILGEAVGAAPMVVLSGANYVKKTIFPLEVLPVISLVQVLIRAAASLAILVGAILLLTGMGRWTIVLAVLPVVPLVLMTLGISWFLAALGVFLRDISHAVTILVQMLFFLTPIVYPLSAVPESFRRWLALNPLSPLVEMMRGAAMWGQVPHWRLLVLSLAVSVVMFQTGYAFFMKSKRAFADVM